MRRLRSPLAFLALSVLLHAVLLAAWLTLGPPDAPPRKQPRFTTIEVDVRSGTPDAPGIQDAAPRGPTSPSTSPARPARGPRVTRAPTGRGPDAAPTPGPALVSDVPRREGKASLLPSRVPPGGTDALLETDASTDDGGLAPIGPDEVARGAVREGLARARRESGLLHAYYAVLGDALLDTWAPQARLRADADFLARPGSAAPSIALNTWLENAKRYGRTGSPMEAPLPKTRRPAPTGPLDTDTVERSTGGWVAMGVEGRKQVNAARRARVLVVQTCEGPLRQARLLEASQRTRVDHALLADLRRGGPQLPRPPDALCTEEGVASVWDFALVSAGELVGSPSGVYVRTQRLEGGVAKLLRFVESH